jgi:hypothetical protein
VSDLSRISADSGFGEAGGCFGPEGTECRRKYTEECSFKEKNIHLMILNKKNTFNDFKDKSKTINDFNDYNNQGFSRQTKIINEFKDLKHKK